MLQLLTEDSSERSCSGPVGIKEMVVGPEAVVGERSRRVRTGRWKEWRLPEVAENPQQSSTLFLAEDPPVVAFHTGEGDGLFGLEWESPEKGDADWRAAMAVRCEREEGVCD